MLKAQCCTENSLCNQFYLQKEENTLQDLLVCPLISSTMKLHRNNSLIQGIQDFLEFYRSTLFKMHIIP
jgi:hypothetical protein